MNKNKEKESRSNRDMRLHQEMHKMFIGADNFGTTVTTATNTQPISVDTSDVTIKEVNIPISEEIHNEVKKNYTAYRGLIDDDNLSYWESKINTKRKKEEVILKVYTPGFFGGYDDIANTLNNDFLTKDDTWFIVTKAKNIEDADLLYLSGGSDVYPKLYNEELNKRTYFNLNRDVVEKEAFEKAVKLGIPIYGICRGLQLIAALSGAKLHQHINHPGGHLVICDDNEMYEVNSMHHQMVDLREMPEDSYVLLGSACTPEGNTVISNIHYGASDQNQEVTHEPEIVFFPKTKAFGVQFHPEMMNRSRPIQRYLREKLISLLELDSVTKNKKITQKTI